jgi:hypothetical protein
MGDLATKSARDLEKGDVLSSGATVTAVDTETTPGVVYVEGDYHYRFQFNHGDPVKVQVP